MDGREANCPSRLSSEQALDDFGGEGGKRGQAAEEAGYRKQLPGQWEMRIEVEHTNGNANQVAAHDVRSERTERQGDKQRIQGQSEQPAHPGTQCRTGADGEKVQRSQVVEQVHEVEL